jgi:hypothetical protein
MLAPDTRPRIRAGLFLSIKVPFGGGIDPDLTSGSFCLDTRELDHLAPLFRLIGNELAEVGRRAREYRATRSGKPRPQLWIGENRVDFPVELINDLGGRVLGNADAAPEG